MAKRHKRAVQESGQPSRARKVWGWIGKIFGTLLLTGFIALLIFACIFAVYIKNDLSHQVDFSVEGFALDQTSVIYYQDRETGEWKELKKLYQSENRIWVGLEDIPNDLINACMAIEDKRFRDHDGVDWLRTIKASLNMFFGGETTYGASTITQQLIKNLTHEDEVTVRRKLVEIFRALDYEDKHSKDDILEAYLNIIPLGEGCSGVQAASEVYFGKNVEDLTLAECASLIGITNNPSRYDPYINPEANKERQVLILGEMLDQGYISQREYNEAVAQELVLNNTSGEEDGSGNYFTYFEDQVINEVVRDLMAQTGYEYSIALKMLQTGGYKIYCTIDPEVQAQVDAVYEDLSNIPDTASSQQLQSAIVVTDNKTGDVVALAGGVGEKVGSLILNRATQSYLSPGSTIKPLSVFAPALEQGLITPATVYDDTPYQFTDTASWPKNSDSTYRGLVSVNDAVCHSLNTVAVKLVAEMGAETSFNYARDKLGLTSLVSEYVTASGTVLSDIDLAPMAMGGLTQGVTVLSLAEAYTVFPNNGLYREARTYTRVTDANGKVILDNTQDTWTAMSQKTAWYSTYMMENTVAYGSGTGAQLENMAVAGKTGTTTSDYDRWFAGYTPYYTAVVWCGYDDPEEVVLTDTTENPAVSLWQKVMSGIHEDLAAATFTKPTDVVTVEVCRDSGLLPTEACRSDPRGDRTVKVELYLEDVPTDTCGTHVMVDICGASDHVANEYCSQVPGNHIYQVGLLKIDRGFPTAGIVVQDQGYVDTSTPLKAGLYQPVSPDVDSINLECYIHSEDDIPKEEDEEDSEEGDTSQDDDSGFGWSDILAQFTP